MLFTHMQMTRMYKHLTITPIEAANELQNHIEKTYFWLAKWRKVDDSTIYVM